MSSQATWKIAKLPSSPTCFASHFYLPLATNYLHFGARLFQEWVVVQWLIAENMKLNWLSINQKEVRADTYNNVRQHLTTTAADMGDALYPDDHRPQVGKLLPLTVDKC